MKNIVLTGVVIALTSCSSYVENDLTTFHNEEIYTLENLPCEAVGVKDPWSKNEHSFLCNMGTWGDITYTFYENDTHEVNKAKLIWKEHKNNSFFPSNRKDVEIVLGRLSDKFAPNDKKTMVGFASRLNDYTFYTDYLKIKHKTEYYNDTPEPYFLHHVLLESLDG